MKKQHLDRMSDGTNEPPYDPRQPPPWGGPPSQPVEARYGPAERPSVFPFDDATTQNPNLVPPVCLRTHWDPEMIVRRTLPTQQVSTPLDPRPLTKVCLEYVTSQGFEDAPRPPDDLVFPSGGDTYPPTRYREAIDHESELRRLDRPLGTCERDQYIPPRSGDMYKPNATVPERPPISSRFISELSFPSVLIRQDSYDCIQEDLIKAAGRSPLVFNNATKQDRYSAIHK